MSFPQPSNDTASQHISSSAAPSSPHPIATAVEKHDSSPERESEASFAISASTSQLTDENMLSGSAIMLFTPPIILQKGIFRGKQMRFALTVEQEPVLGRRKTGKDRRPLGPAPIVRLRAVECRSTDDDAQVIEEEVDAGTLDAVSIVCAADLCAPMTSRHSIIRETRGTKSFPESEHWPHGKQGTSSVNFSGVTNSEQVSPGPSTLGQKAKGRAAISEVDTMPSPSRGDVLLANEVVREEKSAKRWKRRKSSGEMSSGSATETVRARRGGAGPGAAIPERNLYGSLHVGGVKVPDLEGKMGMWFLFTDLCVKQEGSYSLRFRCYDITAVEQGGSPVAQLAECRSQPFRVYSPRQIPMLPKLTELAEHFTRLGFKLNTRKNDKTAEFPPPPPPLPPPPAHVTVSNTDSRPQPCPVQPLDPASYISSSESMFNSETATKSTSTGQSTSFMTDSTSKKSYSTEEYGESGAKEASTGQLTADIGEQRGK
ncbi:hypothetical protein I312_105354 [Cryptococcus bacillisporus CA1280]|uniref:Velvet domain-containing protein n=1 Tax=Cryptococcus bacillisporus CA1280 TaxID=1296109 RepID=A0A0D0VN19_CRYGA|nr:hypothetical protein I312_02942 [Cryptococcus bacillisporus CA1280]